MDAFGGYIRHSSSPLVSLGPLYINLAKVGTNGSPGPGSTMEIPPSQHYSPKVDEMLSPRGQYFADALLRLAFGYPYRPVASCAGYLDSRFRCYVKVRSYEYSARSFRRRGVAEGGP